MRVHVYCGRWLIPYDSRLGDVVGRNVTTSPHVTAPKLLILQSIVTR